MRTAEKQQFHPQRGNRVAAVVPEEDSPMSEMDQRGGQTLLLKPHLSEPQQ